MQAQQRLDSFLLVCILAVVALLICAFALFPGYSNDLSASLFFFITHALGTPLILLTFLIVVLLLCLACSRYGLIRLGEEKPEYSTFSWVAMMVCCGVSSAMLFWAFTDWAYDFDLRSGAIFLGGTPYEAGMAFTFFHWGVSTWGIYCVSGLPVAYYFYIRKHEGLRFSAILNAAAGSETGKWRKAVCRAVDMLFLFTCCTGVSVALGLSVPMITQLVARLCGFEPTFRLDFGVILIIAGIFTVSSYVGLESGMQKLSRLCVWMVFFFIGCVFVCGPTQFMMDSTINGLGVYLTNFFRLSLWTDPIISSGFTQKWTVWYWLYDWSFTPFVGIFVARISRGRTLRGIILSMLGGGTLGVFCVFGVMGNLSIFTEFSGQCNIVALVNSGRMSDAIVSVLHTLPAPEFFSLLFALSALLLLVTSLDSAAYTMAATLTKDLPLHANPRQSLRVFCCLLLVAVPVTMLLSRIPLETLKTCAIISGVPLCALICWLVARFLAALWRDASNT